MPQCCVVPNCNGNYKNGPKVNVFGFPNDKEVCRKWLQAIKRVDFEPTKNSKVCHLHFRPNEIIWETSLFDEKQGKRLTAKLLKPKLMHGAVPSQFPNSPKYLSSKLETRLCPTEKKTKREEAALEKALAESILEKEIFDAKYKVNSFGDFNNRLNLLNLNNFWHVIKRPEDTLFICLDEKSEAPCCKFSIVVKNNLKLQVFVRQEKLEKINNKKLPFKISDMNEVNDILNYVQNISDNNINYNHSVIDIAIDILSPLNDDNFEHHTKIKFLLDQLNLLKSKKNGIRYTSELLIFSSLLFSVAPNAYRFLRFSGNLTLPHPSTIHRICSDLDSDPYQEQHENNFLKYIKCKVNSLEEKDKIVILLMDEIHLKPFLDYKSGNIVGDAFNSKDRATTAYVFMINSISSKFKDVVHIAPTRTLQAHNLYEFILKIILNLEKIGFKVICIVSDNNSINKKAVSYFLPHEKSKSNEYQFMFCHPVNPTRPLFFLIDSVHLLKCIRNNWLNQKNSQKAMFFPPFPSKKDCTKNFLTASLFSLKDLHDAECNSLLKYGYNLSMKALFPSNLERQNVRLVLQIFNEKIVQSLLVSQENFKIQYAAETAEFIKIIYTWWSIVNVKTPFVGIRLKDPMKTPLHSSENDEKLQFLHHMVQWLDSWRIMKCDTGMLSRETHSALTLTINGLIELASYCQFEFNLNYILPGKFQTDNLEARFSLYRQLSGGQYNVSVRQVFECEKKIRNHSLLKLSLPLKNRKEINIETLSINWEVMETGKDNITQSFMIKINNSDIESCNTILPIINYVAGYCIHSVLKKLKCELCNKQFLLHNVIKQESQIIKALDRGGLVYPEPSIVNVTLYTYIVVNKILSEYEDSFLKINNQRQLIVSLTSDILKEEEMIEEEECQNEHSREKVYKMIIWGACNTLLNNYCKTKNDVFKTINQQKKRKLQTVMTNM